MIDHRDCPVCGFKSFDERRMLIHFMDEHFHDLGGIMLEQTHTGDMWIECWCGDWEESGRILEIEKHFRACGGLHTHYHATILGVNPCQP
jgi:hypothetical protein